MSKAILAADEFYCWVYVCLFVYLFIAGNINCQFRGNLCEYSVVNTTNKLSYSFAYANQGGKELRIMLQREKLVCCWKFAIIGIKIAASSNSIVGLFENAD